MFNSIPRFDAFEEISTPVISTFVVFKIKPEIISMKGCKVVGDGDQSIAES